MTANIDDTAFILAAGFGKRLRPYTEDKPKPMVAVGGVPMIDQALDKLAEAGISKCVVNTHYKAEILQDHLEQRDGNPQTIISHEPEILDTGGGIANGLSHFAAPFFVVSGDSVWEDAAHKPALEQMKDVWDAEKMDILLLLQPIETMTLTHGVGDYDLDTQGRATRSKSQNGAYMWTSIRINAPKIFKNTPKGPFSYLELLDEAQQQGRLYGIVHDGIWHHISTPEDLEAVNGHKADTQKRA
jgi:MurNAc alpha-1-phosphate uridylyltransferase